MLMQRSLRLCWSRGGCSRFSLAHSHALTLRETARQMGIKVTGDLVPCAGCSEAEGIKMPVPWSTRCRAKKPLERLFVDLSGKKPRRLVVSNIW